MEVENPNGSAAGITGEEDASVLDNGQNGVPSGMPAQYCSLDPESEEDVPLELEELQDALTRPPPVNSSDLPLPWNGRLGYVSFKLLIFAPSMF
jgi:UV DNA damage endonuclease